MTPICLSRKTSQPVRSLTALVAVGSKVSLINCRLTIGAVALGTVEGEYNAQEKACEEDKKEGLLMAKTSKEVKKLGAKTQTGNMQHKDCPCTQG